MNDEKEAMPEREKSAFDAKGVVANSGVPRKRVTWAQHFMSWALRAPMERQADGVLKAGVVKLPTQQERDAHAEAVRSRARLGRGWWRRKARGPGYQNGSVEIARRRRHIERGLISPIYREVPGKFGYDRYERVR